MTRSTALKRLKATESLGKYTLPPAELPAGCAACSRIPVHELPPTLWWALVTQLSLGHFCSCKWPLAHILISNLINSSVHGTGPLVVSTLQSVISSLTKVSRYLFLSPQKLSHNMFREFTRKWQTRTILCSQKYFRQHLPPFPYQEQMIKYYYQGSYY